MTVKYQCVVVGDSGVGKTCLTCAWSVGTTYKMESLVKSHMSTVFAVDHFMKDKNVCWYITVNKKLIFYCLYYISSPLLGLIMIPCNTYGNLKMIYMYPHAKYNETKWKDKKNSCPDKLVVVWGEKEEELEE
jgi:hypothetical protein